MSKSIKFVLPPASNALLVFFLKIHVYTFNAIETGARESREIVCRRSRHTSAYVSMRQHTSACVSV
jgi:hypothetical protein